jgi:DNA polymerase I
MSAETSPVSSIQTDLLFRLGVPSYREIWVVDFEFGSGHGENPEPVCLVAWELRTGQRLRLWRDELGAAPPYSTDTDALFVAYYASAELGCHLALGWPLPQRVLDLFAEFRNRTNELPTGNGAGLLGALSYFGLDGIGAVEKEEMRALVLRGGPWTDAERAQILDYCESDVAALTRLLPVMVPSIDLPRALLRGRYMAAAARIERNGVPIDVSTFEHLIQEYRINAARMRAIANSTRSPETKAQFEQLARELDHLADQEEALKR